MNLEQFAALKVGDVVDNPMTKSCGVVMGTTESGVRVRWGDGRPGHDVTFFYGVNTTAWMHWTKPVVHASDCAVHNGPALPTGPCSCGAE